MNNPNNPTGAVYSKQELEALAQVCRKYNVIVISDEIYARTSFDFENFTSMAEVYPENEWSVIYAAIDIVTSKKQNACIQLGSNDLIQVELCCRLTGVPDLLDKHHIELPGYHPHHSHR